MYLITLYVSTSDLSDRFITVPPYITLKGVLYHEDDSIMVNNFLTQQKFVVFDNLYETEIIDLPCKTEVENAENYLTMSTNEQIVEHESIKFYSTLFEFNFKPINYSQYYTFKTRVKLSFLDSDGDCVQFIERNVQISDQQEL